MYEAPDLKKAFEYENNFYLSSDSSRTAKLIAQYKIFEMSKSIEGDIFEFGVFKGASISRLFSFREILKQNKKKIFGFDTFKSFPETNLKEDSKIRNNFIKESGEPISKKDLSNILMKKKYSNFELIKGNVLKTLPNFLKRNKNLKISFINLDVDLYEPSKKILELLYNKVSPGGFILLDNYSNFKGETKAVDDFFKLKTETINAPIFENTPFYIKKNKI
jgi:hypothetical protein